ncbi:MAG: transglycosylase SLT domain-containing protein [Anaerovoracaceae bacterium]|nr:transglycosylase SLT domain-containing protein [Bacillota bacterium]MDY2671520.1 transglycosylase SLT domain-containing protein [Anaerovoracaceae bacterium]
MSEKISHGKTSTIITALVLTIAMVTAFFPGHVFAEDLRTGDQSVPVEVFDNNICINGQQVPADKLADPLLFDDGYIYIPMDPDMGDLLGIKAEVKAGTDSVYITEADKAPVDFSSYSQKDLPDSLQMLPVENMNATYTSADGQSAQLDLSASPVLYNGSTVYVPLGAVYRSSVSGWDVEYSNENGVVIDTDESDGGITDSIVEDPEVTDDEEQAEQPTAAEENSGLTEDPADAADPGQAVDNGSGEQDNSGAAPTVGDTRSGIREAAGAGVSALNEAISQKSSSVLTSYIRKENSSVSAKDAAAMVSAFYKYGEQYDIDPMILMAMAQVESNFDTNEPNGYGCVGMMQIKPSTAAEIGVKGDLTQIDTAVHAAAAIMAYNYNRFSTDKKAISAYCYGIGNVSRGTYKLTYYNKVMDKYDKINSSLSAAN